MGKLFKNRTKSNEDDKLLAQKSQVLSENDELLVQTSQGLKENNKLLAQICKVLVEMMSFWRTNPKGESENG